MVVVEEVVVEEEEEEEEEDIGHVVCSVGSCSVRSVRRGRRGGAGLAVGRGVSNLASKPKDFELPLPP